METPKTEISYDIICDKMPNPQSHYSTYELAEKWAKMELAFDKPVYIVKRTTTYEICGIIGGNGRKTNDKRRSN